VRFGRKGIGCDREFHSRLRRRESSERENPCPLGKLVGRWKGENKLCRHGESKLYVQHPQREKIRVCR
jgi:hypothetical protein